MISGKEFYNEALAYASLHQERSAVSENVEIFLRFIERSKLRDVEKGLLVHVALADNIIHAVGTIHDALRPAVAKNFESSKLIQEERRAIRKACLQALKKIFETNRNIDLTQAQTITGQLFPVKKNQWEKEESMVHSIMGNVPTSVKTFFWNKGLLFHENSNQWIVVRKEDREKIKQFVDIRHIISNFLPIYEMSLQTHLATQRSKHPNAIQMDFYTFIYVVSLMDPDRERALVRIEHLLRGMNNNAGNNNQFVKSARKNIERLARIAGIDTSAIDYASFFDYTAANTKEKYPLREAQNYLHDLRKEGVITAAMHDVFNIMVERKSPDVETIARRKDLHPKTPDMFYAMLDRYLQKQGLPPAPNIDHLRL